MVEAEKVDWVRGNFVEGRSKEQRDSLSHDMMLGHLSDTSPSLEMVLANDTSDSFRTSSGPSIG